MNKHLATKVGVLLSLVFLLVAVFGWDLLQDMKHLQHEAKVVEDSNHQSHELHAIEMGVYTNIKMVNDFLITGDHRLAAQFDEHYGHLVAFIAKYEQKYTDTRSPDTILSDLLSSVERIKSKGHEVFSLEFAVGNMEGPILSEEIAVETGQAIQHLQEKHHALDEQVNNAMQMMAGLRMDMRGETMALMVVLSLALMLLTYFIYSQIVLPLVHMRKAVQQVGSGSFSVHCKVSSQDEIGALGSAFNAMGAALQERENKLNRARSLAAHQEKMNAIGAMSAGIAHELGNPLSSVSMSLQVAEHQLKQGDDALAQATIQVALKETYRMESIIQLVLNFGRHESDNSFTFFHLKPVIDDAIRLAQMSPKHKRVSITTNIPDDVPHVYASHDMLMQVLLNLIYNALNACKESGEISIDISEEKAGLMIAIWDTGHGIPYAIRHEVFKSSFTTKTKDEGTGLGLAISKELVDSMHGTLILLDQALNKGTCFQIWLPIHEKKVDI